MIRAIPVLLLLALVSPARASEPCRYPVVIRDGKFFDPFVVEQPGFDPKTSPSIPPCDADGLPGPELRRLLVAETKLETAEADCRDRAASETRKAGAALALAGSEKRECEQKLRSCTSLRLECERDRPTATPKPVRPDWYEKWSLWIGGGAIVLATAIGIATQEHHPATYALGGIGIGIIIGGEL